MLCPRREALRATLTGGLFNNAGRANGAHPSADVSTSIDRDGGRVRATGLTERLGELRGTTYMRAHINYAAIYVHNPLSSTAASIELLTVRPYLKMAWDNQLYF